MEKSLIFLLLWLAGTVGFREMPSPRGFALRNAATPERHQIETMAGGVALFDFDNDGNLDVFLTNGAPQPSLEKAGLEWSDRLFRNLGDWKLEDVTVKAGLSGSGYSMGAAAADFDNDGFADLYVAHVGGHNLYHNRGNGEFENVTVLAGLKPSPWPISAGWFDYDRDGDLDLFIVNYVVWNPSKEPFCGDAKAGYRTYCHPKYYAPLANTLYRNNGDGTFTDVSLASGIAAHKGKGMGVAFADFDGDAWPDVLVTNDTTPNFLFRNKGDGAFEEIGMAAGVALNEDGLSLSSMGADARDINNDGKPDAFVTALTNETFPVFQNLGRGLFKDVTYLSRAAVQTLPYSGWGAGIYDFDNDGWKDLFAANGDVNDNAEVFSSRKSRQPCLLLRNRGKLGFDGTVVSAPALHRGAAFGDLDGDGRIDAVVARLGQPPLLLRNVQGDGNHWLTLKLRGTKSNRDGLGAVVRVRTAGGDQWNHATTGVGYAGSSDKSVHFGLGSHVSVDEVEILWPSGRKQLLRDVQADQSLVVVEP